MKQLPLIQFVSDQYKNVDLQDVLVIACQHILATAVNLFQAIFDKGLKPKNVYLIGKCYSTNSNVFRNLQKLGVNASKLSYSYKNKISFDEQFENYISEFLLDILMNRTQYNKDAVVIALMHLENPGTFLILKIHLRSL